MSGAPSPPPGRFAPLTPQNWPQDENTIPNSGGLQMPTVAASNAERSLRESFTYSGTFVVPTGNTIGQQFNLYIPTDPDGDFWCDQLYIAAWFTSVATTVRPVLSTISISDARTGRAITYPNSIPTNMLATLQRFADDNGFDPSTSPFPDGFRSTSILPQPYCFTRAGGIQMTLTTLAQITGGDSCTIDIGFAGWKEYENAS